MAAITSSDMLKELDNGNRFIGTAPQMNNSKIVFNGEGNVLICEDGVNLVNSSITFNGNDSVVYLSQNRHNYILSVSANGENVFYMGKNNYMNGVLSIILSERKHCLIGDNCLLSFGIWIRNADPHLVYDCESNQRINPSKSIFIGDHVWVGQSAMILKGTKIDSGSIIGAMSLVAGKSIPSNESWGGNPCRQIAKNIFWEDSCVHKWDRSMTQLSKNFAKYSKKKNLSISDFKFEYDNSQTVSYEDIDCIFSEKSVDEKIEFMTELSSGNAKNRFVHSNEKSFKKRLFR